MDSKHRILVVEDDLPTLYGLEVRLNAAGYDVVGATTGLEALQMARSAHPSLIILDVGLPDVSGLELLREFRLSASSGLTPIIVLTGQDSRDVRVQAETDGAQAFFLKPLDNYLILETLEEILSPRPEFSAKADVALFAS